MYYFVFQHLYHCAYSTRKEVVTFIIIPLMLSSANLGNEQQPIYLAFRQSSSPTFSALLDEAQTPKLAPITQIELLITCKEIPDVLDDGFTVLKTVSESSHSGDLFLGAVSYQCYLIFKRDWTEDPVTDLFLTVTEDKSEYLIGREFQPAPVRNPDGIETNRVRLHRLWLRKSGKAPLQHLLLFAPGKVPAGFSAVPSAQQLRRTDMGGTSSDDVGVICSLHKKKLWSKLWPSSKPMSLSLAMQKLQISARQHRRTRSQS